MHKWFIKNQYQIHYFCLPSRQWHNCFLTHMSTEHTTAPRNCTNCTYCDWPCAFISHICQKILWCWMQSTIWCNNFCFYLNNKITLQAPRDEKKNYGHYLVHLIQNPICQMTTMFLIFKWPDNPQMITLNWLHQNSEALHFWAIFQHYTHKIKGRPNQVLTAVPIFTTCIRMGYSF